MRDRPRRPRDERRRPAAHARPISSTGLIVTPRNRSATASLIAATAGGTASRQVGRPPVRGTHFFMKVS